MRRHLAQEVPSVMQPETIRKIDEELERLPHATIADLRSRWRALFRNEPPPAFGPDLLRRSIAQRIQEDAYGALPPSFRRELSRHIKALGKNPDARIKLTRRIKAGAVLVREWKSATHRVMVLDSGFAWQGQTYASLSEIAREITGTRWNGPRFFGLRGQDEAAAGSESSQPPSRRGRPRKAPATPSNAVEARHDL